MEAESENLTQFIVNHDLMKKGNIYETMSELYDYVRLDDNELQRTDRTSKLRDNTRISHATGPTKYRSKISIKPKLHVRSENYRKSPVQTKPNTNAGIKKSKDTVRDRLTAAKIKVGKYNSRRESVSLSSKVHTEAIKTTDGSSLNQVGSVKLNRLPGLINSGQSAHPKNQINQRHDMKKIEGSPVNYPKYIASRQDVNSKNKSQMNASDDKMSTHIELTARPPQNYVFVLNNIYEDLSPSEKRIVRDLKSNTCAKIEWPGGETEKFIVEYNP